MKELSIEEKAKAYDEAKARMSRAFNSNRCTIGFMNEIFPELKESEDKEIREQIVYAINKLNVPESEKNKLIAWLEKQGTSYTKRDVDDAYVEGMAFAKNELEKQGEQKPAWSEETDDDAWINDIISKVENNLQLNKAEINWLKSLKDRYTWKPSDEQMVVLELACKYERVFTPKQIDILIGLKEQLKKLKGE